MGRRTVRFPQLLLVNWALAKVKLERTKSLPIVRLYYLGNEGNNTSVALKAGYTVALAMLFFKLGGRCIYYYLYLSICKGCMRQND